MDRLKAVSSLEDGWLGADSIAPAKEALAFVTAHAAAIANASHDTSVIALGDGLLSLVWDVGVIEYTAEIHPERIAVYIDDADADDVIEEDLPLSWDALSRVMSRA